MQCVLKYAVPVSLCTKCVTEYIDVTMLHKNVTGKNCRSQFLDHDRLNAIETIYEYSLDIWNRGFCDGNI